MLALMCEVPNAGSGALQIAHGMSPRTLGARAHIQKKGPLNQAIPAGDAKELPRPEAGEKIRLRTSDLVPPISYVET